MKNEIVRIDAPELQGIESSKALQIKATFDPMAEMLTKFEAGYNEVIAEAEKEITKEVTARAKRIRIDIGRVRIETEKLRVSQKEEYLRAGKAIDGVSNILKWAVVDKENKLKEIENYFENQECERLEAVQSERAEKLSKYVEDAHERKLSDMEDDVWSAYYESKKKEYDDRIAAEKKVEADRIAKEKAEAAERERIKKENDLLRKEAQEKEKIAKAEAEKREQEEKRRIAKEEAERKAREEKAQKEREAQEETKRAYEAKIKAEREERERVEKIERDKREKLVAELKAKEEAERKAKEAEAAKVQAELSKGDADKVQDLIADITALKAKYSFQSSDNKKMYSKVGSALDIIIKEIG